MLNKDKVLSLLESAYNECADSYGKTYIIQAIHLIKEEQAEEKEVFSGYTYFT